MKQEILEMLEFPRGLARGNLPLEECRHDGNFAPHDPRCRECLARLECEWLFHNDEFSSLQHQPLEALVEALKVASGYVESRAVLSRHNPQTCKCSACAWTRNADRILRTLDDFG
jgi:hypothetical protein